MAEKRTQRRSTARSDVGQFAMVPLWLVEAGVSGEAIRLFAIIAAKYADHVTDTAEGFTRKDLAAAIGKSVDTVDRLKTELVKAGALAIEEQRHKGARLADIFHLSYAHPDTRKEAQNEDEHQFESGSEGGRKSAGTPPHECDHGGRKSAAPLKEPELLSEKESSNEDSRATSTDDAPDPVEDQARQLCEHLGQLLVATGEESSIVEGKVTSERWRTAARRLLTVDGRDFHQALRLLTWSLRDEFWSRNVLSIPKFREKYDQLRRTAEVDKRNPLDRVVVATQVRAERLSEAALRELRAALWDVSAAMDLEHRESFRGYVDQAEFSSTSAGGLVVSDRGWLQMRYARVVQSAAERVGFTSVEFVPHNQHDQRRAA